MLEPVAERVQKDLTDNHGVDIPWEDLLAILIDTLTGCFDSESRFVQAAKAPTRLQRVGLRVRASRAGLTRRQAKAFAECCCDCAMLCSDEELCGCYCEAHELMYGIGGGGYGDVS